MLCTKNWPNPNLIRLPRLLRTALRTVMVASGFGGSIPFRIRILTGARPVCQTREPIHSLQRLLDLFASRIGKNRPQCSC